MYVFNRSAGGPLDPYLVIDPEIAYFFKCDYPRVSRGYKRTETIRKKHEQNEKEKADDGITEFPI
jgi:hypothetical protein